MIGDYGTSVPDDREKFVLEGGDLTVVSRRFLLALFNRTGMGSGIPDQVVTALVASGTVQGDALELTKDINSVDTVAAGTGVRIWSSIKPGQAQLVFNGGANALNVYPPTGQAIDALGANTPYSLATSRVQLFRSFSQTQIRTMQWG